MNVAQQRREDVAVVAIRVVKPRTEHVLAIMTATRSIDVVDVEDRSEFDVFQREFSTRVDEIRFDALAGNKAVWSGFVDTFNPGIEVLGQADVGARTNDQRRGTARGREGATR